jgi:hypothetical protein
MLAVYFPILILFPGTLAVLLSVLERATRRTHRTGWSRFQRCSTDRSRQEQVLGILRSGNYPVCAQRLRLHVPPALRRKHNFAGTGTPFSPWQSNKKPRHRSAFLRRIARIVLRCTSECNQHGECYDSA